MVVVQDEELIVGVARGDREALRTLYDRHAGRVHRLAWRQLGSEADAADATQAVFLGLIDGARHFRPEARFTTWLYRVTVNRCLSMRASAHVRLRRQVSDAAWAEVPAAAEDGPERRLERRQQQDTVWDALDRLPARQRMAVVLGRFEGLSYEEIAAALDCSVGSVESLLFRARKTLGTLLAEN